MVCELDETKAVKLVLNAHEKINVIEEQNKSILDPCGYVEAP